MTDGRSKSPPSGKKRGKGGGTRKSLKGVDKLQFQIKGQDYFLAFVEQEKRWYVFAPTPQGVNRIPVYVDAVKYASPSILETETTLSS